MRIGAVRDGGQGQPHLLRGRPLNMLHVGGHDRERIAIDQFAELPDSQLIGRDLGGDIGQVVLHIAGRIGPGKQELPQLVLAGAALLDQLEIADQDSLFAQAFGEGGHASRHNPADLGMMGTAGRDEEEPARLGVMHGRHNGDVGEVRSAAVRIVGDEHVARCEVGIVGQDVFDRFAHRAQVDRECAAH